MAPRFPFSRAVLTVRFLLECANTVDLSTLPFETPIDHKQYCVYAESSAAKEARMNRAQKIAAAVSLAVLVLCLLGSFLIRGVLKNVPFLHGQEAGWNLIPRPDEIVDQRPWSTAKTLTALAASAEELRLAREAEQLANHEVEQNFAQSLRQAGPETRELTGEALTLQQRVTELQQTVEKEQERIVALKGDAADQVEGAIPTSSSAAKREGDELEAAGAQLSLDQDELSDSRGELARVSGDHREEIQRELSAREAETKRNPTCRQQGVKSRARSSRLAGIRLWQGRPWRGGHNATGSN